MLYYIKVSLPITKSLRYCFCVVQDGDYSQYIFTTQTLLQEILLEVIGSLKGLEVEGDFGASKLIIRINITNTIWSKVSWNTKRYNSCKNRLGVNHERQEVGRRSGWELVRIGVKISGRYGGYLSNELHSVLDISPKMPLLHCFQ